MSGLHRDVTTSIHTDIAVTYADIAARDADTDFSTAAVNINKNVRVNSPFGLFKLTDPSNPTYTPLLATSGIPSGSTNPNGNITGDPGELFQREDDGDSSLYVHAGDFANDTDWVSMRENSIFLFSANSMSPSTTDNFLLPGAQNRAAVTNPLDIDLPIVRPGILKNLRVRHNSPAGNGNDIVYTVFVNNVITNITVTLGSTQTDDSDPSNYVQVSSNSRIFIRASKALDIGTSPSNIYATLGFM